MQKIGYFSFLPVTKVLWLELGLENEFHMVGEVQLVYEKFEEKTPALRCCKEDTIII